MKFMLLIYINPAAPAEGEEAMAAYYALDQALRQSGELIRSEPLQPLDTARCVRIRDGRRNVIDGPAAETAEWLGGYYLVECADVERAEEIAALIPDARTGTVEVRPVLELPDSP